MMKPPVLPGLFREDPYPAGAGFKVDGPSREAAESTDAAGLRALVLDHLAAEGANTADETAAALGRSVLAIRPRFSELRTQGRIYDTGARRTNTSGKRATVWGLVL